MVGQGHSEGHTENRFSVESRSRSNSFFPPQVKLSLKNHKGVRLYVDICHFRVCIHVKVMFVSFVMFMLCKPALKHSGQPRNPPFSLTQLSMYLFDTGCQGCQLL